ncbi:hypothetical protein [Serratia sp. MYb239]|uniref:hypothetical protein n=1 Tax=Serratia sp. MYb239 TaxID=2033438 RepID=UPI0018F885D0|nr:hypothetical protein [Serratia sp. MYb239]
MDAKMTAQAIASGLISIPMDIYLGIERTLQDLALADGRTAVQRRNMNDDLRVMRAVGKLFRDRNTIKKVAEIIINDVLDHLPQPVLQKIHDALVGGAITFTSRSALQIAISTYLGSKILAGMAVPIMTKLAVRGTTGIALGGIVTQGLISRACSASRRLQHENPSLWRKLSVHDFDMLYFLFEDPLKPYIALGRELRTNPMNAEKIISAIENL